jgi:hypothetical protein
MVVRLKQIYLIEAISTHRILYAIETDKNLDDPNVLADLANSLPAHSELRQTWSGEHIENISALTKDGFINKFDQLFPDVKDMSDEEKLLSVEDYDNWTPQEDRL